MALVIEFIKVPRYQHITSGKYVTIPIQQLFLVDKYFFWKMRRSEGHTDATTLEEWCGVPESKLPHKYIVNYYSDFFDRKRFYKEPFGETEGCTIFNYLARLVKANQILRWLIIHVMGGKPDQAYHEITEEKIATLLLLCIRVKSGFTAQRVDESEKYTVNIQLAKKYLPLLENKGIFFGTDEYGDVYAQNINETYYIAKHILAETDFIKETVYVRASW